MILETRHVGINVADMDRSLHFWRDVMGLQVEVDMWEEGAYIDTLQNLSDVKVHIVKLRAPDGSLLELLEDVAHPTSPPDPEHNRLCDRGIRHIAFTVADVEESHRILREEGCEVLGEPIVSPDNYAKVFFARDPEGNLIEIVEVL